MTGIFNVSYKKRGGLHFLKIGDLSIQWSIKTRHRDTKRHRRAVLGKSAPSIAEWFCMWRARRQYAYLERIGWIEE